MSQENYNIDIEFAFAFSFGEKKYQGLLGLADTGKDMFIKIESNEIMRPLDTEKALYQIAHILAEKTRTVSQLTEEKRNIWQ
jgi:hypothetical protein